MTKYENVIKPEVVANTVHLVEQRVKEFCLDQLERKIKEGVTVGQYTVVGEGDGYSIYEHNLKVCTDINSLDVAFSIVQLKLKNRTRNLDDYLMADHNYAKYASDATVYRHIMESSEDCTSAMVAEDRLRIVSDKMLDTKVVLAKLKTEANAAVFDK